MTWTHDFTLGAKMNVTAPLTLEQVRDRAPSVFATHPHESRSARYSFIPTSDILRYMVEQGFQPVKVTQSLCRIPGKADFTKHCIRFRRPEEMESLRVGGFFLEAVLINSHDGTSAYDLSAGVYRPVCTNWAMVSEASIPPIHIKHSGNVLTDVVEGSYRILGESRGIVEKVQTWKQLQLTNGEQKQFADVAHQIRFGQDSDTVIKPEQLLTPRRYDDAGSDLWQVFNRIQENVIKGGLHARKADEYDEHGAFIRRGRRTTTREVRGIDQDTKLNRNLWTLAEAMAALKAA